MSDADRIRLAARVPADYVGYGYAPLLAEDMAAVAGVAVDVAASASAAAASEGNAEADRVQTGLDRIAAAASASAAAATIPATLDRKVGRRANDTSIWTMVRSTPVWGLGPTGVLEETAIDSIRWEFDPATRAPLGAAFAGARTNSLPNPRGEGASGATPPTGWSLNNAHGLTHTYTPTMRWGIPGVRWQISGIANSVSGANLFLEPTSTLGAGLSYAMGCYVELVGGSMAGISTFNLQNDADIIALSPSTTYKRISRVGVVAGTDHRVSVFWAATDLVATINATIFIGAPSRESSAPFSSAPILPPVGTPGASPRAQGTVSIPVRDLGSRYNYRQGVLIVDWNSQSGAFTSAADTDYFGIVSLGDLGANEVMGLLINPAHTAALFRRTVGGVSQSTATLTITPPAAGETVRFAMAWDIDAGFMQVAARGAVGAQLTGQTSIPRITHLMPGRFSTTRPLYGRINGLEIRPAAVWAATLAALT